MHSIPLTGKTEHDPSLKSQKNRTLGVALCILSAILFPTASLSVQIAGIHGANPFLLVLARSLFALLTSFGLLSWKLALRRKSQCNAHQVLPGFLGPRKYWMQGILYGAFSAVSTLSFSIALLNASISDADSIAMCASMITPVLSWMFLREQLKLVERFCIIASFCGILLVSRPTVLFSPHRSKELARQILGISMALLSAVTASASYVTIKLAPKKVDSVIFVLYFSILSSLLSVLGGWVTNSLNLPSQIPWIPVLIMCFCNTVGYFSLSKGLQLAPAGLGASLQNLSIVFAFIFQVGFLSQPVQVLSVLGASIIVLCSIIISEPIRLISLLKFRASPSAAAVNLTQELLAVSRRSSGASETELRVRKSNASKDINFGSSTISIKDFRPIPNDCEDYRTLETDILN